MATASDNSEAQEISSSAAKQAPKFREKIESSTSVETASVNGASGTKPQGENGSPTAQPVLKEREAGWGDYFRYLWTIPSSAPRF